MPIRAPSAASVARPSGLERSGSTVPHGTDDPCSRVFLVGFTLVLSQDVRRLVLIPAVAVAGTVWGGRHTTTSNPARRRRGKPSSAPPKTRHCSPAYSALE
jgi:hypothetical protein